MSRSLTALLLAAPMPVAASTLAFEDNKLNYRSCDGQHITARWRGSVFSLSLPGKSLGDSHETIKYVSWDGRCLTGRWDEDAGHFAFVGDGDTAPSGLLTYVAWDGSKWAGIRTGGGFFVARVASEGEPVTNERLKEIAAWLDRRNEAYSPGAKLAENLKTVVGP
ncbi:hypothetical protein [Hyphomicrobium sp.]|uniref:hypothetical protein n=1 Tax=Hyphomicrobium sp. TaxID=82 RepID=UPI0025BF2F40|nr:hypothetical protein [Hyphomicrobium sp.]MCC7252717.1 hypothetical protein [Hyphomicrobium sp.]